MPVRLISNRLPELASRLPEATHRAVTVAAEAGRGHARDLMLENPPPAPAGDAPAVRTGELLGGLAVEDRGTAAAITAPSPGHFLEFGTRKMAARPFFAPTAEWLEAGELEQVAVAAFAEIL